MAADIKEIKRDWLNRQVEILTLENDYKRVDIAARLDVQAQYLTNVLNETTEVSDRFLNTFMNTFETEAFSSLDCYRVPTDDAQVRKKLHKRLPLVSLDYVPEMLCGKNVPQEIYLEHHSLPNLKAADFLMPLHSSDMLPSFNPGDILAVKILINPTTFLEDRLYIFSTEQGIIIRKVAHLSKRNVLTLYTFPEMKEEKIDLSVISGYGIVQGFVRIL